MVYISKSEEFSYLITIKHNKIMVLYKNNSNL